VEGQLSHYCIRLHEFLGQGACKISIITSALLATVSLLYVFVLGSHLHLTVYYFLTRFTYIISFDDHIVSRYFDSVIIGLLTIVWFILSLNRKLTRIFSTSIFGILLAIAVIANLAGLLSLMELATLPVIILLLLGNVKRESRTKKIIKHFQLSLTLNYLVIIVVILGLYSITISLSVIVFAQSFSVENVFTSKRIPLDNYGYEIFILFSSLSPLLLIVTFFSLPLKYLGKALFQRISKLHEKNWLRSYDLSQEKLRRRKSRTTILLILVLLSISLAIIPQLPTVNKDNQQIGSDSESYAEWITHLRHTNTVQDFIKTAFTDLMRGDRPLSLIILFLTTAVIDAPILDSIEYMPMILGPALVLIIYFFTRELTSNDTSSLFAASLTALGYFQVSMGIYAGFYANWIALLLGYSSLIFLFRFLRTSRKMSLSIFFVLLLATLLSHSYTWTIITIVISIFLIASLLLKLYPRGNTILLLLMVVSTVVIDVTKTLMLESLRTAGGIKNTISLAQSRITLKEFSHVWETLVDATQHHFGGIFSNFMILGLVIYWLMRSNLRTHYNMFIAVFLIIGIPPLFLGDWIVQSRVFYNIPFQVPAAIALTYISRQANAYKILPPIYVWLIAISVWTVSNFYEVTPW
jgi:hypothetical protein